MNRSDAEILWKVASVLSRDASEVSRAGPIPPPLLFFTDPERTPRPWETAARLPAAAAVVYRGFGAPDARDAALRLREVTAARGVILLIGLDAELAETVGADGVHLPERALDQAARLKAARPDWRLSGAAHSREALQRASGLDGVVVSPVFPAGGASSAAPALGLARFSRMVAAAPCPVHALGGVTAANAAALIGSGACGLAAVSAIRAAWGKD